MIFIQKPLSLALLILAGVAVLAPLVWRLVQRPAPKAA
jgi:TctA family transporter